MLEGTYYKEWSGVLRRDMEFKVYGQGGAPVLAFPCRGGRFYDWENNGMPDAAAALIKAGRIQLFCADSIDSESFLAENAPLRARAEAQERYFNYIVSELAPRILALNESKEGTRILCVGADLGALQAVVCRLRRPALFGGVVALSGLYELSHFFGSCSELATAETLPEALALETARAEQLAKMTAQMETEKAAQKAAEAKKQAAAKASAKPLAGKADKTTAEVVSAAPAAVRKPVVNVEVSPAEAAFLPGFDDLLLRNDPFALLTLPALLPAEAHTLLADKAAPFVLCVGQGSWEDDALAATRALEAALTKAGLPVQAEYWGKDVTHDWPWWSKEWGLFSQRIFG